MADGAGPGPGEEAAGPRKRPDITAKNLLRKSQHTTTIKCGLHQRIRLKARKIVPLIDRAVLAMTQITYEGSRLMNLVLLRQLENELPLPDVDLTFVRRCFSRVWMEGRPLTKGDESSLIINQTWEQAYSPQRGDKNPLASFPKLGFSDMLNYAAREYETNCHNHVKFNLWRRISGWLRRRILDLIPCLCKRGYGTWFTSLSRLMSDALLKLSPSEFKAQTLYAQIHATLDDLYLKKKGVMDADTISSIAQSLLDLVVNERKKYAGVLPVRNHLKRRSWSLYLPWLYALMQSAEVDLDAYNRAGTTKGRPNLFSLVPICRLNAKHITIDTTILQKLLRCIEFPDVPKDGGQFREDSPAWWRKTFHLGRMGRPRSPSFTFGRIVKTDGISVSFTFHSPKRDGKDNVADPEEAAANEGLGLKKKGSWRTHLNQWPKMQDINEHMVVGVDPGRRDLVAANWTKNVPAPTPNRRARRGNASYHSSEKARRRKMKKKKERKRKRRERKKKRLQLEKHAKMGKKRKKMETRGNPGRRRKKGRKRKERGNKGGYNEHSFSVSMNQWRRETGSKAAEKQRNHWLKIDRTDPQDKSTSLYHLMQTTPSPKVSTVAGFQAHIEHVLGFLQRALKHNVIRRRVRRLRFDSFIRKRSALDRLCHRLSGGFGMDGVVVMGAATCSSGFGYFPGPVKELRRRLEHHTRVVVIDEHYTSQRCSKCAFSKSYKHCKDKLEPGRSLHPKRRNNIHGVRYCPHRGCKTTWNRDVNAARNMRLVFLAMLANGQVRPEAFQHERALSKRRPARRPVSS